MTDYQLCECMKEFDKWWDSHEPFWKVLNQSSKSEIQTGYMNGWQDHARIAALAKRDAALGNMPTHEVKS